MATNKDAAEKLKQAEEWIAHAPVGSEQWKAAWDHIRFLLGMEPLLPVPAPTPELRDKAQEIANKGLRRRLFNREFKESL